MENEDWDDVRALLEAIVIVTECKHSCICACHRGIMVPMHMMRCCTSCPRGHEHIRLGSIAQHLLECHGPEQSHD